MPNQGWSYWAYKILSWMELKDSEILLQKLSFSLLSWVQGWHTRRLQAPSDLTAGSWCRGTSPLPALGDTKKSILNTFRNTPRHMKQVILRNFLCGSCGSMQGFAKLSLTQCSHITHQSHHIHTTLTLHVRRPVTHRLTGMRQRSPGTWGGAWRIRWQCRHMKNFRRKPRCWVYLVNLFSHSHLLLSYVHIEFLMWSLFRIWSVHDVKFRSVRLAAVLPSKQMTQVSTWECSYTSALSPDKER